MAEELTVLEADLEDLLILNGRDGDEQMHRTLRWDWMGWDGMGWDWMGWDAMRWDGMRCRDNTT